MVKVSAVIFFIVNYAVTFMSNHVRFTCEFSVTWLNRVGCQQRPFHQCFFFIHHDSNSMEILFCSRLNSIELIAAGFCLWHYGVSVVAFSKFGSNMFTREKVSVNTVSIKFEVQCKIALVKLPGPFVLSSIFIKLPRMSSWTVHYGSAKSLYC